MNEWLCVQVNHHNKIAETIMKHQSEGWKLHTYQATGQSTAVNHYLLFSR